MTESVLDIPAVTKKIGEAADAAAAAQVTSGEEQKAIAKGQAELTVALHEQTARNVDRALQASGENALKATGTLIDAAVQKIQTQTDDKLKAATGPLGQTLDELVRLVRSVADSSGQAITNLAGTVARANGELKDQIANLAKVTTDLALAQQQQQAWYAQYSEYTQGYGQGYGGNATADSSGSASNPTVPISATIEPPTMESQDPTTHAVSLALAAVNVADHTRSYSARSVTAQEAADERAMMHKHLENLEIALIKLERVSDLAVDLVGANKLPELKLADWQQELVMALIKGITYSKPVISALELVKAYRRLTFRAAETMGDAVAHDKKLWGEWAGALRDGWQNSRETTLLTYVHDGGRDTYLATSGGDGSVYVWMPAESQWQRQRSSGSDEFASFVMAAPKSDEAHERSKDGDKALLEHLYGLYGDYLGGTIEMVTSIGMCGSCVMVAVQLLHRCPDLKINVRVTHVPDGHGGKTAFYDLKNAGMILSTALAAQSPSSRDGDPLIKKQKLEE